MNDRQFAAAHDRYLDPPDYEEDWLAEKMRQRQECEE